MGVELQGRFRGSVIKYDVERGYGFIRVMDKNIREDAFIYWKEIEKERDCFKKLYPRQLVEFSLERSEYRLRAMDLIPLDGDGNGNG